MINEKLLKEKIELNKKYRELLKKELDNILDGKFFSSKNNLYDEMDKIELQINEIDKLLESGF